mmetsp:Transcript_21764/g.44123  ORF Transcript_21764/g.44123 Transcript_21764/m.44123 type:complete len:275 (+) Transcript_21764:263-1087(+)|eukprot:CAMPEP_0181310040 /NCGR_PEP_ID=MMETSP1101-20121128/12361_1 /TAXON_ID=46948 /ORGANISM="Rhodomonas abbreviata, Strain Caron Lab Isolate" /LENGTH=274 /DNA_ID=CAMNT_0023416617 /DNA_START=262 /DNA_END=1086 /DNA_ORIENTATION=+
MTDMTTARGFSGKMLFVIGASIVLIAAVTSREGNRNLTFHEEYAIAVGAVAILVATIALVLLKSRPESMCKELIRIRATSVDTQHFIAAFLCLWWLVGTTIITFKAPFTISGNGYFAAWAGLLASAMALGEAGTMWGESTSRATSPTVALLTSSVMVVLALLILHEDRNRKSMDDESVFGLISACFTILCCAVWLCFPSRLPEGLPKIIAIILLLLWMATAGILTFRAPFIITGNGYFASWAGLIFAVMLFSELVLHETITVRADVETGTIPQK